MRGKGLAVTAAVLALGALPALADPSSTIAILPFQNLSGSESAREVMGEIVAEALAERGFTPVRGDAVEHILEAERVRYLDSLPEGARARIFQELDVALVATASVYAFEDGDNPIVALGLRLVRADGTSAFWNVAGLSANESEGMFALHRAASRDALAREVTKRLLRDLPQPGGGQKREGRKGKPWSQPPPTTFKAGALEKAHRYRVCLLPFENLTSAREAPQALSQLLWRRIAETDAFEVVEPAELRASMVKELVRSFRDMDPDALRRLGGVIGADLFLRGTLYRYREASPRGALVSPEIALEFSMVDVTKSRILWTSQHARVGNDYQSFLLRGAISNVTSLTDQVVSEMVEAEETARTKTPVVAAGSQRPSTTPARKVP